MNINQKHRNNQALSYLKKQLESGQKTAKKTFDTLVDLTEGDKKRINREIDSLKTKLKLT